MGTVTLALGCAGCGFVSNITIKAAGPEKAIVGKDLLDKFRRQHAAQVSRSHQIVLLLIEIKVPPNNRQFSFKLEPRPAVAKMPSREPWPGI